MDEESTPSGGSAPAQDAAAQSHRPVLLGRHRRHRFPARAHVVKVLYDDDERATVTRAAELAGLRPSGFVAAAALRMAQRQIEQPSADSPAATAGEAGWFPAENRDVLTELLQARLELRRYGTNINQAVAALHSDRYSALQLAAATRAADRAVARVDAAAAAVARRLA